MKPELGLYQSSAVWQISCASPVFGVPSSKHENLFPPALKKRKGVGGKGNKVTQGNAEQLIFCTLACLCCPGVCPAHVSRVHRIATGWSQHSPNDASANGQQFLLNESCSCCRMKKSISLKEKNNSGVGNCLKSCCLSSS